MRRIEIEAPKGQEALLVNFTDTDDQEFEIPNDIGSGFRLASAIELNPIRVVVTIDQPDYQKTLSVTRLALSEIKAGNQRGRWQAAYYEKLNNRDTS